MKHDLAYYLALNYPIEIIREEGGVFAFHPDLEGCAAQGATLEEAVASLDEARKLWIQVRLEDGFPVEEPVDEDECSGRITLRMSPNLHAELLRISRRQRVSLNQFINNALSEYAGGNRLQQYLMEVLKELKPATDILREVGTPSLPALYNRPGAPAPDISPRRQWQDFGNVLGAEQFASAGGAVR